MRKAPPQSSSSGRSARRTLVRAGAAACVAGVMTAGCLRGQAKALPEIPLDMPAPPPRMVEVRDPEEPAIIQLPEEPARTTPAMPRRTPPPRVDSRPPEPRPEPDVRPAEDAARTPPPTLQTAPAHQEGEAERRVRLLLTQATTKLDRINVQNLNADARQQFDTAKRFVAQAEDALRARNLVFATNLADKAAALAGQLAGQ